MYMFTYIYCNTHCTDTHLLQNIACQQKPSWIMNCIAHNGRAPTLISQHRRLYTVHPLYFQSTSILLLFHLQFTSTITLLYLQCTSKTNRYKQICNTLHMQKSQLYNTLFVIKKSVNYVNNYIYILYSLQIGQIEINIPI